LQRPTFYGPPVRQQYIRDMIATEDVYPFRLMNSLANTVKKALL